MVRTVLNGEKKNTKHRRAKALIMMLVLVLSSFNFSVAATEAGDASKDANTVLAGEGAAEDEKKSDDAAGDKSDEAEEPVELPKYTIISKINNGVLYGATADSEKGYSGTIRPNTGFSLPDAISATIDEENFKSFSYNANTGVIQISPAQIIGDIQFDGSCLPSLQSASVKIKTAIGHGSATVTRDQNTSAVTITLVADSGYANPENILIISGSRRFKEFNYDSHTGIINIGSNVVSDMIVSAVCIRTESEVKTLKDINSI